MRRRWVVVLVLFFLAMPLFASGSQERDSSSLEGKEEIVIGFVGALSGPWQILGWTGQVGIDIAVEEINQAGGVNGIPIRIVYKDDGADPTQALTAVTELVENDGIDVFIGPSTSGSSNAIYPYLEENGILSFNGGCTGAGLADVNKFPYVFRNMMINEAQAEYLVNVSVDGFGFKRIALVNDTSAVGISAEEQMVKLLGEKGVEPVLVTTFPGGEPDLLSVAQEVKESRADVIISAAGGQDAAYLLKALEKVDYIYPKVQYLGFTGILIATFAEIAGTTGEGDGVMGVNAPVLCWDSEHPNGYQELTDWKEKIFAHCTTQAERDMVILGTAGNWYDCVKIVAAAIEGTNSLDADVMRAYIESDQFECIGALGLDYSTTFSPTDHEASSADSLCLSPAITGFKPELGMLRRYEGLDK